jgi:hypothetical protein
MARNRASSTKVKMTTELSLTLVKKCRKQRRCVWCNEFIEVGQAAWKRVCIHNGYFNSEYWHPECWDAMQKSDLGYDDEFYFGEQKRGLTIKESFN